MGGYMSDDHMGKPVAFDWRMAKLTHRGNLPHVQQDRVVYFVTFRLGDSISARRREALVARRDEWLKANPEPHSPEQEREFRAIWTVKIENLLDAGYGSCLFRDEKLRNILEETLMREDGVRYAMGDFVIMPNHVHLLVCMLGDNLLSEAVGAWKSISARKIGGKSIWMDEYFDHAVRNDADLNRFVRYIRENPRFLKDGEFALGRGSLAPPAPSPAEEG